MKDFYQDVTNRIVTSIEAGVVPWIRPWSVSDQRPKNAATNRLYRGINALLLGLEAQAHGYASSAWLTYRQAAALNAQVRGGETGTSVVLYKLHEVDDAKTEGEKRIIPLMRTFTVFNVAQIDGLPAPVEPPKPVAWNPHLEAELLLSASGADIQHGSTKAYYSTVMDRIHLPVKHAFKNQGAYYTTALHELTHWTGHPNRCNRDMFGRFGNDTYALEELVAEIGSAYLCAHCRIDGKLQHAAYLHAWLQVLKADKKAIFAASAKAQQAADLLLGSVETEQTEEAAA